MRSVHVEIDECSCSIDPAPDRPGLDRVVLSVAGDPKAFLVNSLDVTATLLVLAEAITRAVDARR